MVMVMYIYIGHVDSMNTLRSWVRMFCAEHEPGEHTIVCPVCKGGSQRAKSFSILVTPEGDAKWICFRAKCSSSPGRTDNVLPVIPMEGNTRRKATVKPYYGELYQLGAEDLDYFQHRFGLTPEAAKRWIRHDGRGAYVLPVYDRYGVVRGYTVRQPTWKGPLAAPRTGWEDYDGPKSLGYPSNTEPFQSWYIPDNDPSNDTVVIVEDQISAIKAADEGYRALALLGTHLNGDRVREIQLERPERTVLALDADAENIACKLAQKWAIALPGFEMRLLAADLKDCPEVYGEIG